MFNRATKTALVAAGLALGVAASGTADAGTRYYYDFGYPYVPAAHDVDVRLADPYFYYPAYVPMFRFGDVQGLHRLERMR